MTDEQDNCASGRRAQAAQWLARLRTLPVSKGTLDSFFEWRRDPANAVAFAEAERLWGDAGRIAARPAMLRLADQTMARRPRARWRLFPVPALMLAAGLVAVVLLAGWTRFQPNQGIDVATAVGGQRTVRLADGSHLQLNTDTRLGATLSKGERRIRLDRGEALFTVAHDRSRPFIVTAGTVEVRATGTRFDVRYTGAQTRVALFQGGVEIRMAGRPPVRLRPGEQWRSDAPSSLPIQPVDPRAATAWTQGRVLFDATPLDQAVGEINRYSQVKVVLAVPGHRSSPISGSFKTGDTAAFARAVSAMLGLVAEQRPDGGFTLRPPPSPAT
ncbi:MAG: FecR domain-containing protein [Sphingobium sp.]|uniref:FecR family protein n=1 Tax=Sphingobium sp. CECT 9361 TaxID=2845384 RepID=UPI001E31F31D|nr:FecR domain-containing protein [Sphingobium sp. CECT 9361]CAH0356643.1 Protein FecR [Sphingobium sp. CECT 9361]